jgi:hypothetical protein
LGQKRQVQNIDEKPDMFCDHDIPGSRNHVYASKGEVLALYDRPGK